MSADKGRDLWAHEAAPEPARDSPPTDVLRYHLARAWALRLGWEQDEDGWQSEDKTRRRLSAERLLTVIAETGLALLLHAVIAGEQDPVGWMHLRNNEEAGEWLWQCGRDAGLDVDRIKPYAVTK